MQSGPLKPIEVEITITPLTLLREALLAGNIEMFRELKQMYQEERLDARVVAFHRAFARAKAEFKPITKTIKASFGAGKASYVYEYLDDVVEAVVQGLSNHGLTHSWKTINPPDGLISVTCVLAHEDGYSEEVTLAAAPDKSGNKNDIQAVGSTYTYLARMTLKAKLGLAAGRDDDAHAAGDRGDITPITPQNIQKIADRMEELGVGQETFFEVMTNHAGHKITQVSELLERHVPFAMRKFDDFAKRKAQK
jgi:hypothetical protein